MNITVKDPALTPTRSYESAAGWDLYLNAPSARLAPVAYDGNGVQIPKYFLPTGVSIEIPDGHYARIAEKSGLASDGMFIGGGVIDGDFRGELTVIARNLSDRPIVFNYGDKIAQLIIEKINTEELNVVETLSTTERGEKAFGSSGV